MRTLLNSAGPVARLALAVAVGAVLGACGSGAVEPPADDDVVTTSAAPTGEDEQPDDDEDFGWGLPEGPRTPDDTFEDDVYVPLAAGDCAEAQEQLDDLWALLRSPRGVLLYQAGIDVCSDDRSSGRIWFDRAGEHGWTGVDWVAFGGFRYDCEVYRALRSVFEQRAAAEISCPGGTPAAWPNPDRAVPRDDPRTPQDETSPTASPNGGDTPSPSASPGTATPTSQSATPQPAPTADTSG